MAAAFGNLVASANDPPTWAPVDLSAELANLFYAGNAASVPKRLDVCSTDDRSGERKFLQVFWNELSKGPVSEPVEIYPFHMNTQVVIHLSRLRIFI